MFISFFQIHVIINFNPIYMYLYTSIYKVHVCIINESSEDQKCHPFQRKWVDYIYKGGPSQTEFIYKKIVYVFLYV